MTSTAIAQKICCNRRMSRNVASQRPMKRGNLIFAFLRGENRAGE